MLTRHLFQLGIVVPLTAFVLSACARPPPVPWEVNSSYLAYAIKRVPAPDIGARCIQLVSHVESGMLVVKNDNYPWDRYTKFEYSPSVILSRAIQSVTTAWGLMSSNAGGHCEKVKVSIQHLAHGIAQGGLGSESPYVCIKLNFISENADSGVPSLNATYLGAASGYIVWWAGQSAERMIVDYNRAAYVALLRSFANGIRGLTGQKPLKKDKSWPEGC